MNTKEITTFEITDGPSRDAIFDSMKYNYEARIPLEFKIVKGRYVPKGNSTPAAILLETRNIEIHTIQHEDGTGFKFNLEGYLDIKIGEGEGYTPSALYVPRTFKAFYNAKTRKGNITIERI